MPSSLRAVSLDLDNTLWDTPPVLVRAEVALSTWLQTHAPGIAERFSVGEFRERRARLAAARPERAHDVTWLRTESLRQAATETGYPERLAEEAFGVFWRERNSIELYEDVADGLARLAARVPVFALTNGNACVRQVGIGRYFRGAIDAAGAGAAKPDRQIFETLLGLASVPAAAILHVGDDALADVHGARLAGMQTAWMNRTGERWPAELPRADHEVADLAALATLVESLT
jgi:putative hydrolase of the HAD superfamily